MAEFDLPYSRIQGDGPNETGFTVYLRASPAVGGPIPGLTESKIVDAVRAVLAGDSGDVSVRVTRYDLTITES